MYCHIPGCHCLILANGAFFPLPYFENNFFIPTEPGQLIIVRRLLDHSWGGLGDIRRITSDVCAHLAPFNLFVCWAGCAANP